LAFAKFAAQHIAHRTGPMTDPMTITPITPHHPLILAIDAAAIKEVVSKYAGVKKSTKGLQIGLGMIQELIHNAAPVTSFSVKDFEANCTSNVALLLFKDAAAQQKNLGVFYNESIA
jgi:aspartate oxidase